MSRQLEFNTKQSNVISNVMKILIQDSKGFNLLLVNVRHKRNSHLSHLKRQTTSDAVLLWYREDVKHTDLTVLYPYPGRLDLPCHNQSV